MLKRKEPHPRNPEATRQRLVEATRELVLRKGFTGAGIDQICTGAGVTKGAFFHHFKSKEEIGQAVLKDWAAMGMGIYATAKAEPAGNPLDHFHRFIDIMIGFAKQGPAPVTCVIGIMSQELALANPAVRKTCANLLEDWTDFAAELLTEAKEKQPPRVDFDSREVAWFLNSLWQGSMLVAKTQDDPEIVISNLARARAYVDAFFSDP